jgi:hypothetical protein
MAKKEEKSDWKSFILDLVKGQIIGQIKERFDDFIKKVQNAIMITEKKLIRSFAALALVLIGIVFLVLGLVYFMIDSLGLSRSISFLGAGIVLILIAIILGQSARLLKYEF